MLQCSNLTTTGAIIASDINSELPLSQDENAQISSPSKSNTTQSSNTPSTTPTSKPMASNVRDELHMMLSNLKDNMKQQLQELKEEEIMLFAEFMTKISTTVYSNKESLKKVESKLDTMTHTVSKLDYQLNKEQEIYVN
eukprot:12316721-Ditylum_brightwellii.AAC.1